MSSFPVPGERIGRFEITAQLGSGGMGVVYEALEVNLGRRVALKVISPQLAQDADFRARFTSEARALASLDSPHCVGVHAHGEEDGFLYIATQLVPDGDLARMLRRWGPAPIGKGVELIEQVASGLADAHAAGFVHRDIKPANILVRRRDDEVRAYLGDFGIARRVDAEATRVGGPVIGTPSYMAPELHHGDTAGVASDVYSVGCLLWVVLAGAPPYPGASDYEVVDGHLRKPVPQLGGGSPLVDLTNRILRDTMAKDPASRYATARELRDDLRAAARMTNDACYLQPGADAAFHDTRPPSGPAGSAVPVGGFPPPAPYGPPTAQRQHPPGPLPDVPARPRRSRTAWWAAGAAAAVAVVAGGGLLALLVSGDDGGGGDTDAVAFLELSAQEMVDVSEQDMRGLDSVRVEGDLSAAAGGSVTDLTLTSSGDCSGTVALGGGSAQLRALGGSVWIRPDATFFGAASGDPQTGRAVAAKLGNRWLLSDPEDAGDFEEVCDLDTVLEGAADDSGDGGGDTTVEGTEEVDGRQAVRLLSTGDGQGDTTAWVSIAAPHHLLRLDSEDVGLLELSEFDQAFEVVPPPANQVVTIEELSRE